MTDEKRTKKDGDKVAGESGSRGSGRRSCCGGSENMSRMMENCGCGDSENMTRMMENCGCGDSEKMSGMMGNFGCGDSKETSGAKGNFGCGDSKKMSGMMENFRCGMGGAFNPGKMMQRMCGGALKTGDR